MIAALQNYTNSSVGLRLLKQFISNEDLSRDTFYQLDELLSIVANEYHIGIISKEEIAELKLSFGLNFLQKTLHGRGYLKPNGYPGDYLFLDHIYTNYCSENPKYKIWDEYVQQNGATDAVRNRKEYFKYLVKTKSKTVPKLNVLNVVSGSGREISELFSTNSIKNVHISCVEIDDNAIALSKELNKDNLDRIDYANSNIFRYRTEKLYDFIWAAGLFDYLNDKVFVKLLKRLKSFLSAGGEMVIGNFNSANNPSKNYMEILGDWHLIHRSEEQLLQLAREAGFNEREIHVSSMPDNMILYLHIQSV
jgi:2-polyprenyl-3-methyl-5-hydroxy-6-metoxy-1,4-benzoquinol methylase